MLKLPIGCASAARGAASRIAKIPPISAPASLQLARIANPLLRRGLRNCVRPVSDLMKIASRHVGIQNMEIRIERQGVAGILALLRMLAERAGNHAGMEV